MKKYSVCLNVLLSMSAYSIQAFDATASAVSVAGLVKNMPNQQKTLQQLMEAGEYYKAAKLGLQLRVINGPQNCPAPFDLALGDAMLACGDDEHYKLGWEALEQGLYKLTTPEGQSVFPRFPAEKTLTSRNVAQLTSAMAVLIHRQKGLGDDAMFIPPYAAELQRRYGCDVIVQVLGQRFKGIMSRVPGITKAITPSETDALEKEYEDGGRNVLHVYSFMLPNVLSTSGVGPTKRNTIPGVERPFFTVLDTARGRIGEQLAQDSAAKKLMIGMCWQAGAELCLTRYFKRSFPLNALITKCQRAFGNQVAFYSLQGADHRPVTLSEFKEMQARKVRNELDKVDQAIDDNDIVDNPSSITLIEDKEGAFEGTIAFACHPDTAVVTVDTSTLHFVGRALPISREFYAAVPHKGGKDWRLEDPQASWYSTMRMFEQTTPGSWDEPLNQIVEAIACKTGFMFDLK